MAVGKEDIKYLPVQDDFFVIKSHDPKTGDWYDSTWAVLAANGARNMNMFMVGGRKEVHVMNYSNVAGTIYVHCGVNPLRIAAEANAAAWMTLPYASIGFARTWVIPVRSLVMKINYVNGAAAQSSWEFSVRLSNV